MKTDNKKEGKTVGRVYHTFGPFVFKEAKVLILGSVPSPKSSEQGFYYGHPQNRFWKVLAAVFGEKEPACVEERKNFLTRHKIALWDAVESCEIAGASDATIRNAEPTKVEEIIKDTSIEQIFATGKTACRLLEKLQGIKAVCLPSPSPANCSVSFEKMVNAYSQILKYLQ